MTASRTPGAATTGTARPGCRPAGTRPGPVKEAVAAFQGGFADLLRGFAATAIKQDELAAGEDPDQVAFELNGIILAADANFVLHDDPAVLDLARQVVRRRLGPASNGNAARP